MNRSLAEWKLYPQCKVLIDGRYEEVFPDDVFELAMRLSVRQGAWWEVVERFPTDIVVLPKQGYSLADLPSLRGGKPVYQDHVSLVLLPLEKIQGPLLSVAESTALQPCLFARCLSSQVVSPGVGYRLLSGWRC